jgi:hypothetical protein
MSFKLVRLCPPVWSLVSHLIHLLKKWRINVVKSSVFCIHILFSLIRLIKFFFLSSGLPVFHQSVYKIKSISRELWHKFPTRGRSIYFSIRLGPNLLFILKILRTFGKKKGRKAPTRIRFWAWKRIFLFAARRRHTRNALGYSDVILSKNETMASKICLRWEVREFLHFLSKCNYSYFKAAHIKKLVLSPLKLQVENLRISSSVYDYDR